MVRSSEVIAERADAERNGSAATSDAKAALLLPARVIERRPHSRDNDPDQGQSRNPNDDFYRQ